MGPSLKSIELALVHPRFIYSFHLLSPPFFSSVSISFNNKLTEWLLKNGFFSRNCFVI